MHDICIMYNFDNLRPIIFFKCLYRIVALESQLVRAGSVNQDEGHDLHILAGHEASY